MALKVFSAPPEICPPKINYGRPDYAEYQREESRYLDELADLLRKRSTDKNVGEVVRFPHADGYACYMVAKWRPLQLVHLELGDGWHYPYVERLTAADIEKVISRSRRLAAYFKEKEK